MNLRHYLSLLHEALANLEVACHEVGAAHAAEPDVETDCARFARRCSHQADALRPFLDRYGTDPADEPARLHRTLFDGARDGPIGLLRDLHDLYLMSCECDITWTMVDQSARGARDTALVDLAQESHPDITIHLAWIRSRMKQAAPQALVVAR
jgi:hypothetical protein